jgi:hypothetical protein
MAGFQNAAMTRADSAREKRRPFYLYADEYATPLLISDIVEALVF